MTCSLRSLRARVESLATSDGRFGVACARTGFTPVPVAGLWFESREDAGLAARFASAYRARLRRFDPAMEYHDLVVHECPSAPATAAVRDAEAERRDGVEARPSREDGD
ncbi:DUF7552 domain-containing protein [Natronoarchaeum rubrum]|uniref:DUF7552 domain-containing protein n=1 Tax=Natronoarchaeum rubrum TaxID=755311 RepID=UPI0021120343|nr:hypothetical protein [Natronoarchaeum rubrum]